MQEKNKAAPIPEALPGTRAVTFIAPFKYSPRGFDMRKCKPGETLAVPDHIANLAIKQGAAQEAKLEDVEEEVKEDSKPANAARRGGR